MYRQKMCLALLRNSPLRLDEQIFLFGDTGFNGFFHLYNEDDDLAFLRKRADAEGMIFQSVHAPFRGIHSLWYEDGYTKDAICAFCECIEKTADVGVDTLVVHSFSGFAEHTPNSFGLQNYEILVKKAQECHIRLAIENLEGEEYLFALMDHFREVENVGFCWDSGHEMCYSFGKDLLKMFGDRLFCTHLNDNLGVKDYGGRLCGFDDLHLLPFDGNADWEEIAKRLVKSRPIEELTFESKIIPFAEPIRHESDRYAAMSIKEYLATAYARACRVAALYQKYKNQ